MKKLFGLILALIFAMNVNADRLFMVGDATPQGWNVGTSEMKATELIETAPGIFTWTGKLKVGSEGFKVSTSIGQWGNWHPSNGYSGKLDQTPDVMREGDPDTKWQVSEDGIYTVTINWNTKEISAVKETYTLSQDGDDYYLLGNAEDLFYYSQWSCHGAIDNKSKAKLTADIDFSAEKYKYASIGVADYAGAKACFSGEFDGQGHTITVAIEGLRDRAGLFGFVRDAVIKNLIVDGTVSSSRNCSGGLGGRVDGSVTVDNVIVKTALTYTTGSGDATFGGFFANTEGNDVFTNCAFIGSINVDEANGCGGFVGWAGSGSNTQFVNCFVAPTSYTKNGNSDDYARNKPTVTNCYAVAQDDARLASGELCYLLNGKVSGGEKWYQNLTDPKDATPVPFATSAKVYANGALDCAGNPKGGDLTFSNTEGGSRDPHAFTDGFCSACNELDPDFIKPTDGVYSLATAVDLVWFSAFVNAGNASVNAKLTADINMTGKVHTPIGTNANKYKGTFDGQNHTVDNIVIEGKSYSGFFGYLTGDANIKNLVIGAGCAFSGDIKIGGLASMAAGGGTVTLSRVVNMATATSSTTAADANAAGLISCCIDGTKVNATYCLNAGKITGKPGECAAFTGWSQGGSKYTNCLNVAEVEGMQDNRNLFRGDADVVNCFEASSMETTTQGIKADVAKLATGELCYLLNGDQSDINWFQTIGTDAQPTPFSSSEKVLYVGDAGYATFFDAEKAWELQGDATANIVTIEGTTAKLTAIDDIPVGTAVVLSGTYYNQVACATPTATTTGNVLKGAATDLTAAQMATANPGCSLFYALRQKDAETGFYWAETDGAAFAIEAGKGYLALPAGSQAISGFRFGNGEETTGIESLKQQTFDGAIYNLQGQRVNANAKGIIIMNGKKVFVK